MLRPGSTVLVDDPCYFNFRALLKAHQANVIGVPYTPAGPDVTKFEAILRERPRLYITNSALHNPTGATMSPQTAHRLLNAAMVHDVIIVEDEIFADFEPEPSPRLAALDGLNRVIRIGSFSEDAVCVGTVGLHRRAARVDRGSRRPSSCYQFRRPEPRGSRIDHQCADQRRLPQAHG